MSAMLKSAIANSMKKAGPRRCLFGLPDRTALKEAMDEQSRKLDDENKTKWNFDFAAGIPVAGGNYEWTVVSTTPKKTSMVPPPSPAKVTTTSPRLTDITEEMKQSNNIKRNLLKATRRRRSCGVQAGDVKTGSSAENIQETFGDLAKKATLGIKRKRSCSDITEFFSEKKPRLETQLSY